MGERDYKEYGGALIVRGFHIVMSLNLAHEGILAYLPCVEKS
jgi:hypothetical protein